MTGEGVMTTKVTEVGVAADIADTHNIQLGTIVRFRSHPDDRYVATTYDKNGDLICELIDTVTVGEDTDV